MNSSSRLQLFSLLPLVSLLLLATVPAAAAPQGPSSAPLAAQPPGATPNATPFDLVTGAATQDFSTLGTFTLPAGATITLDFDVTVNGVIPAGVTAVANQASTDADQLAAAVPSDDPDTGAADDPTVTLLVVEAELGLTKTDAPASATSIPGQPITYHVVVTNAGPFGVLDAEVSDLFPAALSGCTWACAGTGNCDTTNGAGDILGVTVDLEAGEQVTFMITCDVDPTATGTLTNTALVDPPAGVSDPGAVANMASDVNTLVPTGDLSITKTTDTAPVVPGSNIQYTIVVANSGPSDATGVDVDDVFPAAVTGVTWTCAPAGGAACPNAAGPGDLAETVDLPAGGSLTYTVSGTVDPALVGSLMNTASLTVPAGFTDTDGGNDSDSVTDNVDSMIDVAVTKTTLTPPPIVPGAMIQYQIVVDNGGPSDAAGVAVADAFPAALTGVSWICAASAGSSCTAMGNGDLADNVTVAAGGDVTYTVSATVSPTATGTLSNTATITPPMGVTDASNGDDSSTVMDNLVPSGDLSIDKQTLTSPVVAGQAVSYQIVVANTGPSTAVGAQVQDNFPASLTGVSWTCTASAGSSCTAGPVMGDVLDMVTVAGGGNVTYTVTGTLHAAATGVLSNTATVSIPGGFTDTNMGNESDTVMNAITLVADLTILKLDSGAVPPGGQVVYTIVVTNLGPADVVGATVTDTLPPELANASWTCVADPGAACTAGPVAGDLNDTVDLPAGASVTYTLTADVTGSGQVINTATVEAPDGVIDPDGANSTSSVTTLVSSVLEIPTLSPLGFALLALLLGGLGLWLLRRRGAAAVGLALLLVVGFAGAAEAQVLIDSFTTAQGPNADPPGGPPPISSTADTGGADILGGERDLAMNRVSGTGTVTGEVTGGFFEFDAPALTRGEATLTWDGNDDDPDALDPVGLGGVDLTATGQSGFRLTVDAADAGVELIVRVFTDGANHSQAGRLVATAIAATTDVFIPFSELRTVAGAGADLTDVGAVVLVVRGEDVAATLANLETAGPLLAVEKVDLDPNTEAPIGASQVPAGATIRYRVTLTNTGSDATTVDVSDVVDPNTTLVANTLDSTPVAVGDAYRWYGNVTLEVDGTPLPTLLANDADPDGDVFTITASDAATVQGGVVQNVDTNSGAFDYLPPPGFNGVDSFTYTIEDDDGNASTATATIVLLSTIWFVDSNVCPGPGIGTQADPFCALMQAESASGPDDIIRLRQGADDLTTHVTGILLKSGQRLIGEGVDLVVDGVHIEGNGAADGNLDPNPANRPSLTHSSMGGEGITLADGAIILGLNVEASMDSAIFGSNVDGVTIDHVSVVDSGGAAVEIADSTNLALTFTGLDSLDSFEHALHLDNVTGSLTVTGTTQLDDPALSGIRIESSPGFTASFGPVNVVDAGGGAAHAAVHLASNAGAVFTFGAMNLDSENGDGFFANNGGTVNHPAAGNVVNAVGGAAVDIESTATGNAGGWSFDTLTSAGSPDHGVRLVSLAQDFSVGAASTTVTDADLVGILVQSSGAGVAYDFGPTSVTDTNVGAGATANGIDLATGNSMATFTFDSLTVVTDGGFGLLANDSGTINVGGTDGNSIVANGGAALDVTSTTAGGPGWTFDTLSSAGSPGKGVNLDGVSGAVTGEAGAISSATGVAFDVNGGNGAVSYSGTITNTASRSVEVTGRNAGAAHAVSFSGMITDSGAGIFLDDNDVVTLGFSGGIDLDTATNNAFTATNGGTLNVTQNNTTILNTVDTTTGVAVTITDTTIGGSGATFRSIAADGASSGIVLANAGAGGFNVVGDGAVGASTSANNDSGGTLINTTDDGVQLTNLSNVSLNYMRIQDAANHGIDGDDVTNFTLTRSNLVSNGNANLEHGLMLLNPAGSATVANVLGDGNFDAHLRVFNETGNDLTLFSVDDSVLQNVTTGFFEDGISFEAQTGVTTAISVTGSTFHNHDGDHVQASTNGATDATVTITGNTMTGAAGNLGAGITVNSADTYSGTTTFDISNNDLQKANDNSASINVNIGLSNASGSYSGTISGNTIGTMGNADSAGDTGITVQVNRDATMTVLISNNTIREFDNNGISVSAVDGTGDMLATLTGNTVTSADSNVFAALFVDVQTDNEICLDAGDDTGVTPALENTFTASAGVSDVALRTGGTGVMNLEGYAGAASNAGQIESYMQNRNVGSPGVIISVAGGPIQGGGACATP